MYTVAKKAREGIRKAEKRPWYGEEVSVEDNMQ
jgi:hypothetical protein